jgi:hypothetical protein
MCKKKVGKPHLFIGKKEEKKHPDDLCPDAFHINLELY